MNFSEFKRRLGAEPRSTDAELLAARTTSEAHATAAAEAERFESALEDALRTPAPDGLQDAIMENVLNDSGSKRLPMWLSMAASILLIVGATSVVWMQTRPAESLEHYVQSHYGHDGESLLALANAPVPEGDVQAVLAGLGMHAGPAMAQRVRYIKFCPTLHGKGAHMVLASDAGLVTVIYMPDTSVAEPVLLEWDGIRAEVIALSSGSAAIIGAPEGSDSELHTLLKTGIRAQSLDT